MANYDGGIFVGHGTSEVDGSYDPGACANGKQEHIIAEKIVDKAVNLCSNKGLSIHRDEQNYKDNDVYGNTYSSKYIISVHLNAGGGKRCEVYVPCKDTWLNPDFYMVQELAKLGLANDGVKSRDYNSGNTYMRTNGVALPYTDYYKEINVAKSCGISLSIIEVGFIDSSDIMLIEKNIDKIAIIIANAMLMACGKELYNIEQNNSDNNVNVKEEYKMKYAICYCNEVDERNAKLLRDYLGDETQALDARIKMNWNKFAEKGLINIGGNSTSGWGFSSYATHWIKGDNRYSTAQLVSEICCGKRKLDDFKIK